MPISCHDIDYVVYVAPGITRGRILRTGAISMWINDIKCKYMFMTPLKNLARKGLRIVWISFFIKFNAFYMVENNLR